MPVGRNPEESPLAKAGARVEESNRPTWVVALRTEEGWPACQSAGRPKRVHAFRRRGRREPTVSERAGACLKPAIERSGTPCGRDPGMKRWFRIN